MRPKSHLFTFDRPDQTFHDLGFAIGTDIHPMMYLACRVSLRRSLVRFRRLSNIDHEEYSWYIVEHKSISGHHPRLVEERSRGAAENQSIVEPSGPPVSKNNREISLMALLHIRNHAVSVV